MARSRCHRPSHGRLQLCFRAVSSAHSLFLAPVDLTPAGNRKAWEWDPEKVASGPECDTLPPRHWYLCCEHQLPHVQHLPLGLNLPQKGSLCLLLGYQLCISRTVFSRLALLQSENHLSRSFSPDQEVNNSLLLFCCVRTRWGGRWTGSPVPAVPAPLSQPPEAQPLCHVSLLLHGSADLGA